MRKVLNISDATAQRFIEEVLWCGLFCRKEDLDYVQRVNEISLKDYENYPKDGYHVTCLWNGKKQVTDKDQIKLLITLLLTYKSVSVVGYGDDGSNNGFEVKINSEGYLGASTPHITWSWKNGSSPVKTVNVPFVEVIPTKINVYGRVFTRDGKNISIEDWIENE